MNIYGVYSYRDSGQSSSSWGSFPGKGSCLVSVYFLVFFRPFDFPLVPGAKEEGLKMHLSLRVCDIAPFLCGLTYF